MKSNRPFTVPPASNASKEAVTVGTRLFLPKTQVNANTQPGPNCPSTTDVAPAAPETPTIAAGHKVKDVETDAMQAGD